MLHILLKSPIQFDAYTTKPNIPNFSLKVEEHGREERTDVSQLTPLEDQKEDWSTEFALSEGHSGILRRC